MYDYPYIIHYISEAARCDIRDIITSLRPSGAKTAPKGGFGLMFLNTGELYNKVRLAGIISSKLCRGCGRRYIETQ